MNAKGNTPPNFKNDIVSGPTIVVIILSLKALTTFCINNIQNTNKVKERKRGTSDLLIGHKISRILEVIRDRRLLIDFVKLASSDITSIISHNPKNR